MKPKGHFETASDFQRESQAILVNIGEDAFETWTERRHRCIRSKLEYLEGWQPKLSQLSQNFIFLS
jgi:hypothetical protein